MKRIALIGTLFFALQSWGQHEYTGDLQPPPTPDPTDFYYNPVTEYADPGNYAATFVESWMTTNVRKMRWNSHLEFLRNIVPTAVMENEARGWVEPHQRIGITAASYTSLCDGFFGGALNSEKRACDKKLAFLVKSAIVVNDLIDAGTRYKVNNGIRDQIHEKYFAIVHRLHLELTEMEVEKTKRGLIQTLFR